MIKMLQAISGPGLTLSAGAETDAFSKDEEARLIAAGFAEAVKPAKRSRKTKTETATAPAVEIATEE